MSISFILVVGIAVLLAIIGIAMNRARTQSGTSHHHEGAVYMHQGDTGGPSHSTGDTGAHAGSHDSGGFSWGDSGSGGDGGGGDGGGGE